MAALSADLTNLFRRYLEAIATGDSEALEGILSRQPILAVVGTDPDEVWNGPQTILAAFKTQMAEMGGGFPISAKDPKAYMEATAGWGFDTPTLKLADGSETSFRMSVVFLKENGQWRIVQSHASIGIPNEEAFGKTLTI